MDLDCFLEAISAAEVVGATLTSFVANPADALTIAKIRAAVGSNETLLQCDPTSPTRRSISGVPLFVSPTVAAGVVSGIARDRVVIGLRNDTRVEVSRDAFFSSDRLGIRATLRAGFGSVHPAAVVKIAV